MTVQMDDRPTRRETQQFYRGRALQVRLYGRRLELKEKGRRDVLSVDYATIYEFALKLRWRKEQAERKLDRQGKGKGR